jgi:hypothetical protein
VSLFSFEEQAFIQRLKHKNFQPSFVDEWWDYDIYGDMDVYEPAYDERTDKVAQISWEWDVRIDRALVAQMKRRAYGL